MKKLVFAITMCMAAMNANSQVITSKTIDNVYEKVINQTSGNLVYHAERTQGNITTMYTYQKVSTPQGEVTLKPSLKHEYTYTPDDMLSSRVTYRWSNEQNSWLCVARLNYTLTDDSYCAEYSRYNHETHRFEQPQERMVYALYLDDAVNYITYYHRDDTLSPFRLVSQVVVNDQPLLYAMK